MKLLQRWQKKEERKKGKKKKKKERGKKKKLENRSLGKYPPNYEARPAVRFTRAIRASVGCASLRQSRVAEQTYGDFNAI